MLSAFGRFNDERRAWGGGGGGKVTVIDRAHVHVQYRRRTQSLITTAADGLHHRYVVEGLVKCLTKVVLNPTDSVTSHIRVLYVNKSHG